MVQFLDLATGGSVKEWKKRLDGSSFWIERLSTRGYRDEIIPRNMPKLFKSGEIKNVNVEVKNTGSELFLSEGLPDGRFRTALSYHWFGQENEMIDIWDNPRAKLPTDLKPGKKVALNVEVKASESPGKYIRRS